MTNETFQPRKPLECLSLPTKIYAYGFSYRKRDIVRRFLGVNTIEFVSDASAIKVPCALLVWGRSAIPKPLPEQVEVIRLEDGFLRSVGLGADLIQPISWVLDTRGIYFDATVPSDLENMLQTYPFDAALLQRAEHLRQGIVAAGITKYNVGAKGWRPPSLATAKKIILVPGQVETDASIQYGALGINTNLDLLKAVRGQNPEAYVVYKPHPDVAAGLRARGKNETAATEFCNEILVDVPMDDLLSTVDEVHVLTSLTGFEALLRGKKVTCYGMPFFAGWGLTQDLLVCPRRTRALDLKMLCAGTLILYPTYISRRNSEHITPEAALTELIEWRRKLKPVRWHERLWQAFLRRLLSRP